MTPTARTLVFLRQRGYTAGVVERWLPRVNRRRDLFGCIDVLAVHPREKVLLGVQATTIDHVAARLAKARGRPELAAWLKAGGVFEVHGWCKRGERWQVKVVAVRGEELAGIVVSTPRRRRRPGKGERQRELFPDGPEVHPPCPDAADAR